VQHISKGYEQTLIKLFGEVGQEIRKYPLDLVVTRILITYFAPIFHPIKYFQWDSNSSLLFTRLQHYNGDRILYYYLPGGSISFAL